MTSISIKNSYGGAETSSAQDDLDLYEMIVLFSQALRGAGYCFDGRIELVGKDEVVKELETLCEKKKK